MSDVLFKKLTRYVQDGRQREWLLWSSHVLCIFCLRPFSNVLELVWLFALLVLIAPVIQQNVTTPPPKLTRTFSIALVVVSGCFIRFTFSILQMIITLAYFFKIWQCGHLFKKFVWVHLLTAMFSGLLSAAILIAYDSWYFTKLESWVVTPYNALMYNRKSQNLAMHGIHPRWLHLAVNLPILIGPIMWYCLKSLPAWRHSSFRPLVNFSNSTIFFFSILLMVRKRITNV